MGIGQRIKVQLAQVLVGQDTDGQNIEELGDKFGVWAEISHPSGFRQYLNGQTQLEKTRDFLVRFRFNKYPDVDWKIIYEGFEWTITEIQKINEKRFYWLIRARSTGNRTGATQGGGGGSVRVAYTTYSDYWIPANGATSISGLGQNGKSFVGSTLISVERELAPVAIVSGTPGDGECSFTGSVINFWTSSPFNGNERVFIIWNV